MDYRSIYELFQAISAAGGDSAIYSHRKGDAWVDVTWPECRAAVAAVGKGLIALGVAHGDRVSILGQSRLEWVLCDLGTVTIGAVTVGIYPSNLAPDCAYIINHSDSEVIFVENGEQLEKVLSVREDLPRLRHIVIVDGPSDSANGVLAWDEFLSGSAAVTDEQYAERGKAIQPDDLASIVYTSGTTGLPKGAMITHGNLLFTSDSARQCLSFEPHYCTLFFLPLAHIFARLIAYTAMAT